LLRIGSRRIASPRVGDISARRAAPILNSFPFGLGAGHAEIGNRFAFFGFCRTEAGESKSGLVFPHRELKLKN
jgi:hypothetical protein